MKIMFKRFFEKETCTYTYFLADSETKECALIDTVQENKNIYIDYINKNGFQLKYLLETHVHADHITATGPLKQVFPHATIGLHKAAGVSCSFQGLSHGDTLSMGSLPIQVYATPGHTIESLCFLANGNLLFTGDTLLIGACGNPFKKNSFILL